MKLTSAKIGFIGSGNMAEAILKGLINQPGINPTLIHITDVRAQRVAELSSQLGVTGCQNNTELMQSCEVIILAVKPQNCAELLREIQLTSRKDQLFVSILAGTTTYTLETGLTHQGNPTPRVIRVMPNTPALISRGVTAFCKGTHSSINDATITCAVFEPISIVKEVQEPQMDAVTGLTGSGPAYVFAFMEALITAGISEGLPEESVPQMVIELVSGAAELARTSTDSPSVLRQKVTSPNGTTAAGLAYLQQQEFAAILQGCVHAATERSRELAKGKS